MPQERLKGLGLQLQTIQMTAISHYFFDIITLIIYDNNEKAKSALSSSRKVHTQTIKWDLPDLFHISKSTDKEVNGK